MVDLPLLEATHRDDPATPCLVLTTVADKEQAQRLAETLVGERLAACVQMGAAMTSVYRWQGEVEVADEIPIAIKTTRQALQRLAARLLSLHPYTTPEVVVVPIMAASTAYRDWIVSTTNEAP